MGESVHMVDLQSMLSVLDRDAKSGKLLPEPKLAETFRQACPLCAEDLAALAQCLNECSEQIYEYYRPLVEIFRREMQHVRPDEATVRLVQALGIADDEDWERGKETSGTWM